MKSLFVGTLTTNELVARMQSDKHNYTFNVAANLNHVDTHENVNWRLVSALSLFVLHFVSSQMFVLSRLLHSFLLT